MLSQEGNDWIIVTFNHVPTFEDRTNINLKASTHRHIEPDGQTDVQTYAHVSDSDVMKRCV